jgi:hypothetical protein
MGVALVFILLQFKAAIHGRAGQGTSGSSVHRWPSGEVSKPKAVESGIPFAWLLSVNPHPIHIHALASYLQT